MIELAQMDVEEKAFRFLFRHFLSLGFIVEDFDEKGHSKGARGFCTSGSLFEYKGFYAILTAGHVIQDVNKMVEKGKFKVHGCYLLDCFGHEGVFREPFAFDYDGAPKELIHDEAAGLDFGLIGLRRYHLDLIARNGLVAINEANWRMQHTLKFDFYLMAGLPTCWSDVRLYEMAGQQKVEFLPSPTCFRVDRRTRRPGGIPVTKYRRFIGHISPKIKIDNIEGMSGGPIFGFRKSERGLEYWIVAVQSGWIERRRITFGCPLPTIGGLLDAFYEEMVTDDQSARRAEQSK